MESHSQEQLEDMLIDSPAKAIELLTRLVGEGNADAMFVLGMAYYDGDGVERDALRCADLLAHAAALGHVGAIHDLGCFYYYGYGFPEGFRDWEKSAALLAQGVERCYTPSMTFLGSMYEHGEGVPKSYETARALFKRAAKLGDELGRKGVVRVRRRMNRR